jgi:hypothetical protein
VLGILTSAVTQTEAITAQDPAAANHFGGGNQSEQPKRNKRDRATNIEFAGAGIGDSS